MHELRQQFPLDRLLEVVQLRRSTYFYQLQALKAADKYAEVKLKLRELFHQHKGRYGYRRLTLVLRQLGHRLNHKTVQRLLEQLGLKSLVRPKKYRSFKGEVGQAADNLLKRKFKARRPNQKWVTDVTEFTVGGEKLYLSPVKDLFNGEIVSYEMSTKPQFALVSNMLKKALRKLKPGDRPLLHSDQGWQYRMPAYQNALQRKNVTQSMSRRGNCLDNAAMESFFAILKTELFYLTKFKSVEQLKNELVKYLDYYNNHRISTALGGLSPVQYRKAALAAR